jgi:hypothetical protein
MNGNKAPAGSHYFCRGCGQPLPSGWHAQFHPECLKADKRRRTQEKRRLERVRLQQWLHRQRCPQCGAALAEMLPNALTVLADHGEARSDPGVSWAMAPSSESSH